MCFKQQGYKSHSQVVHLAVSPLRLPALPVFCFVFLILILSHSLNHTPTPIHLPLRYLSHYTHHPDHTHTIIKRWECGQDGRRFIRRQGEMFLYRRGFASSGGGSLFLLSIPHICAYIRHFLLFCPLVGVHLPTEQAISIAPHRLIPSPAFLLAHYLAP